MKTSNRAQNIVDDIKSPNRANDYTLSLVSAGAVLLTCK